MTLITELPPLTESIIILLCVVLLKYLLSAAWPDNTMVYFRFYCQRLSDKVNKAENSRYQQQLSGLIAFLITLLPLVTIIGLFEAFIAIEWLWQAVLLYFALGDMSLSKHIKSIVLACQQQDKLGARALLKPFVLRDVSTLSPMGIYKATIEMQLLKNLQWLYAVGFWFILLGPIAALTYRLTLEMHYSWNSKREQYREFGKASALCYQYLNWLPGRLFYLIYLISISGNTLGLYWRLTRSAFFSLTSNILLALHALVLNVQLGGVAIYGQEKLRRVSFNAAGRAPEASDTLNSAQSLKKINIFSGILLVFVAISAVLPQLLSQ
ncbi:cobalamin biosynthesis protein CobD/CbiB [Thalassotalea ganghwensis]